MHEKIRIFSEPQAIVKLGLNPAFREGILLKRILKCRAEIILIMDEADLQAEWDNLESPLRRFYDSFDLPRPRAVGGLKAIYSNPLLCYQIDPCAIWFLNRGEEDINNFKEYMGIWAINPESLSDDYFELEHSKGYERNDTIDGKKDNGWGNYLAQIPKELPPLNSIVLNDRHLVCTDTKENYERQITWGLHNLTILLNELMPQNLKVPFHILVYCLHAETPGGYLNPQIDNFIRIVKKSRSYKVEIEFIFNKALHSRDLYGNYFSLDANRGFNVFYTGNMTMLNGENKLTLKSYLSSPFSTGDTPFQCAQKDIRNIKEQCEEILINPAEEPFDAAERVNLKINPYRYQYQKRVYPEKLNGETAFINRLINA